MSINVVVTKELVFPQLEVSTKEEVITLLADALERQGFVKDTYKDAILIREKEYPTGLPSTNLVVAIPHADNNLVNTTSIAVAALKNPVKFHNMEEVNQTVEAQIVIMMAIAEPHGQVEMLQRIIGFVQNDDEKNKLVHSVNEEEILAVLKESILKEDE